MPPRFGCRHRRIHDTLFLREIEAGLKRNLKRKAYNPLVADWLIFLFKIGGFGAVLLLAVIVMGKWLKQIAAALNSYVTAYAQKTAKIDARMKHLEQHSRFLRADDSLMSH